MGKYGPGKRRVMRSFKMTAIALVDDPAQEGADIVLRKRRDPEDLAKAKFAVMTSSVEGHAHLIEEWGDSGPFAGTTSSSTMTGGEGYHSHPWQVLDDGSIEIGESAGHTHEVDATKLLAAMKSWATRSAAEQQRYAAERAAYAGKRNDQGAPAADEARETEAAGDGGGQQDQSMTKQNDATAGTEQAAAKQAEANAALEKRLARAEALAQLNDAGKAHLAKLADDPARERFLAMSAAEQAAAITKAAADEAATDPVVYVSKSTGRSYRRSAGEDVIALAKDLDVEKAKRAETEASLRKQDLRKRAGEELAHLPGTIDERAELLAAIDAHAGDNDGLRKSLLAALKAGNTAAANAFKANGSQNGALSGNANGKLDKLAKARAAEKGLDYYTAYGQVAGENPALAEAALVGSEEAEGEL